MSARLITRFRSLSEAGTGFELVVWRLPGPVPPSTHPYKYRLVYLIAGERVIGFDNERGKGDHRHVGDAELPYRFEGVDKLIDDFFREVELWSSRS